MSEKPFFVAIKMLRRKNLFFFTSNNMLSLMGVIIGVFSLIIVISVMEGFERDIINKVVSNKSEIKITKSDNSLIADYQNILSNLDNQFSNYNFAPIIEGELMLKNNSHLFVSNVIGIDVEKQKKILPILDNLLIGELKEDSLVNGIIIGISLSLDLSVTVGEYVQLTFPVATVPSPFGLLPKTKRLKVVGIYDTEGRFESMNCFISLQNSQYFFTDDDLISEINMRSNNPFQSARHEAEISQFLGGDYRVRGWHKFEKKLFSAINIEQKVVTFALFLMILLSAMNLMGNMVKLITEKKKELGVLKAMGASRKFIRNTFLKIGFLIGTLGSMIGASLAGILLFLHVRYQIINLPLSASMNQTLPVAPNLPFIVGVIFITIMIMVFSSLIAVQKITKTPAIRIIRDR